MVCDKMHESTRPQEAVISCGFGPKQRLKILFKPEGTTCELDQVKQEKTELKSDKAVVKPEGNTFDPVRQENKEEADKWSQTKEMKEVKIKEDKVLRLRGGGGEKICCGEDCRDVARDPCPLCDHHFCFCCSNEVNGTWVCTHCGEEPPDGPPPVARRLAQELMPEEDVNFIILEENSDTFGCHGFEEAPELTDDEEEWMDEGEDEEKNLEEENNEEEEIISEPVASDNSCLSCGDLARSIIAHLRRKTCCESFYFIKYSTKDYKKLAKIIYAERKKEKRKNPEFRKAEQAHQNLSRKRKKLDTKFSHGEFLAKLQGVLSTKCHVCEQFVCARNVEVMENSLEDKEENEIFRMCKWCKKIKSQNDSHMKFEGKEDDPAAIEYEEWAKDNFQLDDKIKDLEKSMTGKKYVGMKIFEDQGFKKTVIYPVDDPEGFKFENADLEDNLEVVDPTFLLPVKLPSKVPTGNVSRDEAELATRSYSKHLLDVLSVMIQDRFGQMESKKTLRMKMNEKVMKGKIVDNKLSLKPFDSLEGCLSCLKGSEDWWKESFENFEFKQYQNGFTSLKIYWQVFTGFDQVKLDPHLAACLVKHFGLKVQFLDRSSGDEGLNREYRVCCDQENKCDPFDCKISNYHKTPYESLKDDKFDINAVAIAKFINEKINIWVDKVVKPNSKDYSFVLQNDRPEGTEGDSGFNLVGIVWLESLDEFNLMEKTLPADFDFVPEVFKPKNMFKIFGGTGDSEVTSEHKQWNQSWYSIDDPITMATKANVDCDENNTRETSLFETITCCAREMPMAWSSQRVVYLNIDDPRKSWETFKIYEHGESDEQKKILYNHQSKEYWVEEQSVKNDYRDRPVLMEALLYLQQGLSFRTLERSNQNFGKKLEELRLSGGIEVELTNLVPLVTNRERFPTAPQYLPKLILIRDQKILILKRFVNVAKFRKAEDPFSNLLLCEPWRSVEDLSKLENNVEASRKALKRRKELLPFSCVVYPDNIVNK